MTGVRIGSRLVGEGTPVYVVAEMSANHNQNLEHAIRTVQAIKDSGADAVKLQTYTPDTLTIDCDNEHFRVGNGALWAGRRLYDLYREAFLPWEWHARLKQVAGDLGLDLFSTAFDDTAVDYLEALGVPAYKVASFELVDLPLIERIGRTGKPMILSTGMATMSEIEEAVKAARHGGASEIALLKCTSAYPAPAEEMHLRTIPHLASAFQVPVGLSDHTLGIAVPIAGVAVGACIVEKHFTLSRSIPGPDSAFSLEPDEFKAMVAAIHTASAALGSVHYGISAQEESSRVFRRSLFVVRDVKAGEAFTRSNLRSIRPGYGLPPRHLNAVLGQRAVRDIARGSPLEWSHVASSPP